MGGYSGRNSVLNKIGVGGAELDSGNMKAIEAMFKQLPKQVSKYSTWMKFWRLNTKPLVKAAQNNAPLAKKPHGSPRGNTDTSSVVVFPGALKKSIGFFTTKASKKYLGAYVGPRVKGKFSNYGQSGWYGAFVEYGGEVNHYGKFKGKNQPYMKRAWEMGSPIVLANGLKDAEKIFERQMKSHEKRMQKYGKLGY